MRHIPDDRLYRVSGRWEDYTNYGMLQDSRESVGNLFPLHMDTWYYDNAFSPVGMMDLGKSGAAFAGLVQLRTDMVNTHYWHPKPGRPGLPREAFWERRSAEVPLPPETVITGTIIRFDARATLRGPKGYIGDRWLRNVGALQLGTRRFGSVQQHPAIPPIAPKFALLHLDIVSLFLPDNQATLAQTRAEWERLRAEDPTVTIDEREDSPALPVVTLVDPPPSTPSDNRELYEQNGPRLARAISTWEELTHHRFVWEMRDR
ncbi:MAG: hypothetical protein ACM3N4_07820 [Nitrososphaerota archaeon]